MKLFDLLQVPPTEVKTHLAVSTPKGDDPLNLYFSGDFKRWQQRQTKRNFKRRYILSLIQYPGVNKWLFVGVYESLGLRKTDDKGIHHYNTKLTPIGESLIGRLIIKYKRAGRHSYPYGESLIDSAAIHEIKAEPVAFNDFVSFKEVLLTRDQLETLFKHDYSSWRSALSSVSGVYLISDKSTGMLYVGSASGNGGIWSRWKSYAETFHGNNKALKRLYSENGEKAFKEFQYAILETADIDVSPDRIAEIETRWKIKLLSREWGYNRN